MNAAEVLLKSLDVAVWELGEAFKGLPDADVWKRAAPNLLSVGEIAAHIAYGESMSFFGEGYDSPLATPAAHYYTSARDVPFALDLSSEAVYSEVKRIHEACKAAYLSEPRDLQAKNPNRSAWTWYVTLEYQAFHIAYHAGQIYSVRHLLGHETEDN